MKLEHLVRKITIEKKRFQNTLQARMSIQFQLASENLFKILPMLLLREKNTTDEINHSSLGDKKLKQQNEINKGKEDCIKELNEDASKSEWTTQEVELVFRLHNQFGNKWAIIADHLEGKSDNCVKNYFYSRLRKGLRKVNKFITDELEKAFKCFKIVDLYKVIQASDENFKEVKNDSNEMTDLGFNLKNGLFIFAEEQAYQNSLFELKIKQLIDDFSLFTREYKRKSKKNRRYSPMGAESIYRTQIKNCQHDQELVNLQIDLQLKQPLKECQKQVKKEKIAKQPTFIRPKTMAKTRASFQNRIGNIQPIKKRKCSISSLKIISERNRVELSQFSQDQESVKKEGQELREKKLDIFAINILKTFQSCYSLQNLKPNCSYCQQQ